MMKIVQVLVLFTVLLVSVAFASEWTYDNLGGWGPLCKTGMLQSPIDLGVSTYRPYLDHTRIEFAPTFMKKNLLQNNGHSLVITPETDIFLNGGGLIGEYQVAQMHFHFGSSSKNGSEHTVNQHAYAMEMHVVTFSTNFLSLGDALDSAEIMAVAVVGVFFEETMNDNMAYQNIVNGATELLEGIELNLKNLNLDQMLPNNREDFYRYAGSLTTPPCTQMLSWTVFSTPVSIGADQMNTLRETLFKKDGTKLSNNFRPVQQLKRRKVGRSFIVNSDLLIVAEKRTPKKSGQAKPQPEVISHKLEHKVSMVAPPKVVETKVASAPAKKDPSVRHVSIDLSLKVDSN